MKIKAFLAVAALSIGFCATPAFAAVPFYQVTQNGSAAQITVSGTDANAPVVLYYYPQNSAAVASVGSIGSTNASGYFSATVTGSTYSIPSGSNTYVSVDGQVSSTMPWPYLSGSASYGTIYLSPSAISMSVGQSSSVTISGGGSAYYVSSNSNPSAVNTTVNGSVLNLYGVNSGYATVTVCANGTYSSAGCANLSVSVGSSNTTLQLSQNSLSLSVGQASTVSALNSNGASLFVSSNSNPNFVTATANGNSVYITAIAQGSSVISICSSIGYSSCGVVNVTVTYNYNNAAQNVTLSQNSLTVPVGQNQQVAIYGSGSYYVSSNSNPNAATASTVGNTSVIVRGVNPGSSTITVCSNQYSSYSGNCATLYVTVNSNYAYGYGYTASNYLPPVANGVYLSQVPYTGIADDLKMLAFVSILVAASGIVAYFIVGKKVFA